MGAQTLRPPVEIRVHSKARQAAMPASLVRRIVRTAIKGEDRSAQAPRRRGASSPSRRAVESSRRIAEISVTFLSRPAMQRLNHDWLGHDRPTDVISFALPGPNGKVVGDMYICPAEARAEARRLGIRPREELTRLLVHGVLHLLGYDHPEGPARTASSMWRRQEHYVTVLV